MRLELDAHRSEIARDLRCCLVIAHEQRALAAPAGRLGELARQGGLGSARYSRDQCAAAAIDAAAEHRVKTFETCGNAFAVSLVREFRRLGRAYLDSRGPEAQRKFRGRVA